MTVAFTICSNNYLAHAATLVESWFKYHNDTLFYVVLVDELNPAVDYAIIEPAELIMVKDLGVTSLGKLIEKYNITELNTAVKPDAFLFLFNKFSTSKILYIDPDILIKGKFEEVLNGLDSCDFVLTPHICSPIDDNKAPNDYHTLRTGIFNLGFIALKESEQIISFLHWWRDRVYKYGFVDFSANMFYDQIWANFIPVFYEKYLILKHPGYNMANWNLHERVLCSDARSGKWFVNGKYDLKFFHFSSYKFQQPDVICSYQTRFDFISRPDLVSIFKEYHESLIKNGAERLKDIPCVYFEHYKKLKEKEQVAKRIAAHKALPLKTKVYKKLISLTQRFTRVKTS